MARQLSQVLLGALPELRVHPVATRIRAYAGGEPVVDSRRALLVWEPRRVVPSYAVPLGDVSVALEPVTSDGPGEQEHAVPVAGGVRVLDPRTPFAAHSTPGQAFVVPGRGSAAFCPHDPDLAGYAILDFRAFDEWREEDEPLVGHPRDPFSRIETRRSSRHVVVELDGEVLADSVRPTVLVENHLPVRHYLPPADVRTGLLAPSDTHTVCAYKGVASYFDVRVGSRLERDLVWTYRAPLTDALAVEELFCFFDERVDTVIDGRRSDRPLTPWSE
jgi:uncharacterized protein (DUF427 family)